MVRFDVAQYRPEEVTVKTVDNRLLVHAKHEEKTPSRTVYREYNQVNDGRDKRGGEGNCGGDRTP